MINIIEIEIQGPRQTWWDVKDCFKFARKGYFKKGISRVCKFEKCDDCIFMFFIFVSVYVKRKRKI